MRVICISEYWPDAYGYIGPKPKIGDRCTVIDVQTSFEVVGYELEEFPKNWYFKADHFIEEPNEEIEALDEQLAFTESFI